jgi:two-component system response regulator
MTNKSILLIDDNENDILLAQTAFARGSVRPSLIVMQDGQDALDYLFQTGKYSSGGPVLPACVLLDLNMPRIDGFDVIAAVRKHARTELLPLVVLTSSMEPRDIVQAYRLGANSYVRKPVDFDQFVQLAEQMCQYWLRVNELPPE